MNSEIRLRKSRLDGVRRALLVIAVIAAWTVAAIGMLQDHEGDSATDATPRIEKKSPQKPHYIFMVEMPV
jgi:hypothetical protein